MPVAKEQKEKVVKEKAVKAVKAVKEKVVKEKKEKVVKEKAVKAVKEKKEKVVKKKKEKEGAKYVANGTYGCVLKPADVCPQMKLERKTSRNKVSKLFNSVKAADEEYKIQYDLIKSIDPRGAFTVKMFDKCPVKYEDFKKEEIDRCKHGYEPMFYPTIPVKDIKDVIHNSIINIVYEDGGMDLSHLPVSTTFEEVFLAMKPLVSGMVKLNAAKLSHTDIKPDNLVYKKNKVSLIDFGLSCEEKKVYTKEMNFAHIHPYPYYPPEFIEYANHFGPMFQQLRPINLSRNYHYLFEAANKTNRSSRSIVDPSFHSLSHNLDSLFTSGYSDDDLFDPSKVDIFSLGATWLILYYVMAQKRKRDYKEIETLILGMLQPIAKHRFDSKQVRKYYNLIHKSMQ